MTHFLIVLAFIYLIYSMSRKLEVIQHLYPTFRRKKIIPEVVTYYNTNTESTKCNITENNLNKSLEYTNISKSESLNKSFSCEPKNAGMQQNSCFKKIINPPASRSYIVKKDPNSVSVFYHLSKY